MIGVSILLFLLSLDGYLSRFEGILFILIIILYTKFAIHLSQDEIHIYKEKLEKDYGKDFVVTSKSVFFIKNIILILGGLLLLVLGAQWLVESVIQIARLLEVSELVIGLTLVAAGTSLPELATSIVATFKGERDIAIGNVVGSNIYNILAILGVASILPPSGIPVSNTLIHFDIPVMIAVSAACLPIFLQGI